MIGLALVGRMAWGQEPAVAADAEAAYVGAGKAMASGDAAAGAHAFEEACSLGHGGACTAFGLLLAEGRGVGADPERASRLLKDRCTASDLAACRGVGILLSDGRPPDDPRRAASLLEMGCVGGDLPACAWLGGLFADAGDGIGALKYFGLACTGGLTYGCSRLAAYGASDANPEGWKVLRENCRSGEPWACAFLEQRGR